MRKQWWASCKGKQLGPSDSRDEEFEEYIRAYPDSDFVTTGCGPEGPNFDVTLHQHRGGASQFATLAEQLSCSS
jgi:hypothetical protein